MSEVYIHVGTIKTGTKFLQKMVFPKLKGIMVLWKKPLSYDLTFAETERKILITDERLSGWGETKLPVSWRLDTFKKLKGLFPDAKIIITLRTNEEEFLESNYAQMRHEIRGTLNHFGGSWEQFLQHFDMNWNNHEMIIDELKSVFGEENILVLYYAELVEDVNSYVKKICDFMGVKFPIFKNLRVNVRHPVPKKVTMEQNIENLKRGRIDREKRIRNHNRTIKGNK